MASGSAPKTIVVGVGNTIHSDDGAGVHALKKLQGDPRVPGEVLFIDGGTHGIELLAYLYDSSRLLLLDAVDVGERAGTLVRMTGDDLRGLPGGASVHQLGVADLLATLPLVSESPREIVLLGLQSASTDWGTELSSPVEAALGSLVEAAVEQLLLWSQDSVALPVAHSDQ
ncbi:MAG: hydrogenase maturation protease [Candidatus Acidiferrum sp.]